jgi:hypothetical protein
LHIQRESNVTVTRTLGVKSTSASASPGPPAIPAVCALARFLGAWARPARSFLRPQAAKANEFRLRLRFVPRPVPDARLHPKNMAASKNWQLTPFQYTIDFALVPLLFGLAVWPARISSTRIAIGALTWSFVEYAVHRFLFHRRFRRDHWAHHLDPTAYIGISGVPICAAYALLLIPAWHLGLLSVHAGFMLGYFCYLVVHYAIHRTTYQQLPILRVLTRNHELHHQRGRETNFGVTSPLWDFIFCTYSRSASR